MKPNYFGLRFITIYKQLELLNCYSDQIQACIKFTEFSFLPKNPVLLTHVLKCRCINLLFSTFLEETPVRLANTCVRGFILSVDELFNMSWIFPYLFTWNRFVFDNSMMIIYLIVLEALLNYNELYLAYLYAKLCYLHENFDQNCLLSKSQNQFSNIG